MTNGAETAPADKPSRPRRLRRRQDFLVAAAGRRFHTERLSTQARSRTDLELRDGAIADGLYVGFTLTKRVGHATERNRIRRRLRRAIEEATAHTVMPSIDLVIIGRRPALSASYPDLVEDLRRALDSANKRRDPKRHRDGSAPGANPRQGAQAPRRRGSDRPDVNSQPTKTAPHGTIDG